MNDESPADTSHQEPEQIHPVDIMRKVLRDFEFKFEDEPDRLTLRLRLERVDVQIICGGNPNDVANLIVNLPIRATREFRPQTGEFLHRLNFGSKRKFWEFDHNDGEIRLAAYMDTIMGPLTPAQFRGLLHCMIQTADTVFPYLTSVLAGRMTPEFAADQAEAAICAQWRGEEKPDDAEPDV